MDAEFDDVALKAYWFATQTICGGYKIDTSYGTVV